MSSYLTVPSYEVGCTQIPTLSNPPNTPTLKVRLELTAGRIIGSQSAVLSRGTGIMPLKIFGLKSYGCGYFRTLPSG